MTLINILTYSLFFGVGFCYGLCFIVWWIKRYGYLTWNKNKNEILIFKKVI